jgi:hypothetical protein
MLILGEVESCGIQGRQVRDGDLFKIGLEVLPPVKE